MENHIKNKKFEKLIYVISVRKQDITKKNQVREEDREWSALETTRNPRGRYQLI